MDDCPQFIVDKNYNKQTEVEDSPFARKLEKASADSGVKTSPQKQMADEMPDTPFLKKK